MKNSIFKNIGCSVAAILIGASSYALEFDEDVTSNVIFGSGNANGGFTVDRANGVELGLRAKLRFDGSNNPQNQFNSGGDGTYTFDATLPPSGFASNPGASTTSIWNFEWSINSNFDGSGVNLGGGLNGFSYQGPLVYSLMVDFNSATSSSASDFFTYNPLFDPTASYGNNSTAQGAGVEPSAPSDLLVLPLSNNLVQNSVNMEFLKDLQGTAFTFDGSAEGVYDIKLSANKLDGTLVASTQIQVISATVPDGGKTLGLLGLGLLSLAIIRRRLKK